jgi:short-subunit dehydrogenase
MTRFTAKLISRQVYISSRDVKTCEETATRLSKMGPGKCIALPGDLSKYDECVKLAKEIEKREGGEYKL